MSAADFGYECMCRLVILYTRHCFVKLLVVYYAMLGHHTGDLHVHCRWQDYFLYMCTQT